MKVTKESYAKMAEKASPPSPSAKNYVKAFVIGGAICCLGQLLVNFFKDVCKMDQQDAQTWESVVLIAAAALLTSLGAFQAIAKHAGAGTLVPITGFANAIVSPAIEFKSEGYVFGVGAKMFIIAGPVLVYGIASSVLYGLILWILKAVGVGG